MAPRPLHLGPITTIQNISRLPYARMVTVWLLFAIVLILFFVFTHR